MKCREEAAAAIGCGVDTLDPWCMNCSCVKLVVVMQRNCPGWQRASGQFALRNTQHRAMQSNRLAVAFFCRLGQDMKVFPLFEGRHSERGLKMEGTGFGL